MTGTVYTVAPIPPDAEHTTWVDAGAIRIGVEYRVLDDAGLAANYHGDAKAEIDAAVGDDDIEDNGVSLHVVGRADGHEYLRFDLFSREPHYHYIDRSGERQTIIDFDRVAHGDMLPWALAQLRGRLAPMLQHAGGEAVASELDTQRVESSLVEVEKLARAAESDLAAAAKRATE